MDSLQDIMGNKQFARPDEVKDLMNYVKRIYHVGSRVVVEKESLILYVPSSAAAAMIQLDRPTIEKACKLKRKLVVRTGR